jgi:uncharacterized protein
MLDEAFNNMARSLKDRDDRLQKAFQRITVTERLASLGQMARGWLTKSTIPSAASSCTATSC